MVGEISFSFIRNEHTGEQFSHFGDFDPNMDAFKFMKQKHISWVEIVFV